MERASDMTWSSIQCGTELRRQQGAEHDVPLPHDSALDLSGKAFQFVQLGHDYLEMKRAQHPLAGV